MSFGRFLLKSWVQKLSYIVLLRGMISVLFLIRWFNCKMKFVFLVQFSSVLSYFEPQPRCFFNDKFGIFLFAAYPSSWNFCSFANIFSRCFWLFTLVTLFMSSSHTGVCYFNVLSFFISKKYRYARNAVELFFESVISIHVSSRCWKVAVSIHFFR